MTTHFLVLAALFVFGVPAMLQQKEPGLPPETPAPAPAPPTQAAIPAADVNLPNPVHPTPESQARAKQIYTIDCSVCHGADGSGKGDIPTKAKMLDYRDPASLKTFTDGQIFYIIKNGKGEMPPEGPRANPAETWNLVIYLRSFSKEHAGTKGSS